VNVVADDDVIFAGCWRVRSTEAGKLLHAGMLAKLGEGTMSKAWPADMAILPHAVRRAIPVIITLDGTVFYPQLIGINVEVTSKETALSAQFLGQ